MKEYGTNVQKLVDYILKIQDREKRTKYAYLLVELMRQVHPNMRDNQDYSNKLWDDLYIMSKFKLDVDSPFPPPSPDAVGKLPKRVPYNGHELKFRYYGRNVELLINRAVSEQDTGEKKILVSHIARLMKTFYQNWNREVVDDDVIWGQMLEISGGHLAETIRELAGNSQLGNLRNNNNRTNNTNTNGRNDGRDSRGGDSRDSRNRNNNTGGSSGGRSFGGNNNGGRSEGGRSDGGRSYGNGGNNGGRGDNSGGRGDNRGGRSDNRGGNDNNRNRR
jgi:hypothetical protein